jgi:hypothetical protein
MANEQTSVPLYAAAEVLTAENMNISAGTGVPVFATTVTRDAAFGGAGEKVLAEGQLCYLSASNIVQYYDGAAWATVGPASAGALTLIATASPSAVASISFNNCFSATYQNYLILVSFSAAVGANASITMRLRASGTDATTNYNWLFSRAGTDIATVACGNTLSTTSIQVSNLDATNLQNSVQVQAFNPFAASRTEFMSMSQGAIASGRWDNLNVVSYHSTATSYDGITFLTSGTSFTGTIRVYGYSNS